VGDSPHFWLTLSYGARVPEERSSLWDELVARFEEAVGDLDIAEMFEEMTVEYELRADPWRLVAHAENLTDPLERLRAIGLGFKILSAQAALVARLRDLIVAEAYMATGNESAVAKAANVDRKTVREIRKSPPTEGSVNLDPDAFQRLVLELAAELARPLEDDYHFHRPDPYSFAFRPTKRKKGSS
jgi:hypothetical protein